MKTCPYCREQIHADASRCPHCQATFTADEMAAGEREQKGNVRGKVVLTLAAIAAFFWWLSQPGAVEGLAEWTSKQDAVAKP